MRGEGEGIGGEREVKGRGRNLIRGEVKEREMKGRG
jgi:hypothetical protein